MHNISEENAIPKMYYTLLYAYVFGMFLYENFLIRSRM